MKNLPFVAIIILAFCSISLAQTNETSTCPTISVSGPPGVTEPGSSMTFVANVSGNSSRSIDYLWSISEGRIISGQGSRTIAVSTRKWADTSTTATVTLKGLPSGCQYTASEQIAIAVDWTTYMVDSYGQMPQQYENQRLSKLDLDPVLEGPFQIYFDIGLTRKSSLNKIRQRASQLKKYLIEEKKVASNRIFFVFRDSKTNDTKIYFVPYSGEAPTNAQRIEIKLNLS